MRKQFSTLCGAPGSARTGPPREQRHSFVSVLSNAGVDIEEIADAVGHINSTVTKAVYRHQIADENYLGRHGDGRDFRGCERHVRAISSPSLAPRSQPRPL